MKAFNPSPVFAGFIRQALDKGFENLVQGQGVLKPLCLTQNTKGVRIIHRLAAERYTDALLELQKFFLEKSDDLAMYGILHEGRTVINGGESDVILLEAGERRDTLAAVLALPYQKITKGLFRKTVEFERYDPYKLIERPPTRLAPKQSESQRENWLD